MLRTGLWFDSDKRERMATLIASKLPVSAAIIQERFSRTAYALLDFTDDDPVGAGEHFLNDFAIQGHEGVIQNRRACDTRLPVCIFEAQLLAAAACKLIGKVLLIRV